MRLALLASEVIDIVERLARIDRKSCPPLRALCPDLRGRKAPTCERLGPD